MSFNPDYATSPGEVYRLWCEDNEWAYAEAMALLGMSPQCFDLFIAGDFRVEPPLAENLARITNICYDLWLNLDKTFVKRLAAGCSHSREPWEE